MAIRAIVFDIGGVLEMNPELGWDREWEQRLNLKPGKLKHRLSSIWRNGSIGTITEAEVHRSIAKILGMSEAQVNTLMAAWWVEYVGTPNVEMIDYFRGLRPPYQTAIISNSFVGATQRELPLYHFDEMCDFIIYSHEVQLAKPDPRIFTLALDRLGVQPAEMIFLDDREDNVDTACKLGIHGIVFKDNRQAIAEIEACIQAASSQ